MKISIVVILISNTPNRLVLLSYQVPLKYFNSCRVALRSKYGSGRGGGGRQGGNFKTKTSSVVILACDTLH